jgi:hypothetical protein
MVKTPALSNSVWLISSTCAMGFDRICFIFAHHHGTLVTYMRTLSGPLYLSVKKVFHVAETRKKFHGWLLQRMQRWEQDNTPHRQGGSRLSWMQSRSVLCSRPLRRELNSAGMNTAPTALSWALQTWCVFVFVHL